MRQGPPLLRSLPASLPRIPSHRGFFQPCAVARARDHARSASGAVRPLARRPWRCQRARPGGRDPGRETLSGSQVELAAATPRPRPARSRASLPPRIPSPGSRTAPLARHCRRRRYTEQLRRAPACAGPAQRPDCRIASADRRMRPPAGQAVGCSEPAASRTLQSCSRAQWRKSCQPTSGCDRVSVSMSAR